jgi:hypothetical protein
MVLNNRPTVAEVNDVANTLLDGAHGLVLAAETAIGVDPSARSTWSSGRSRPSSGSPWGSTSTAPGARPTGAVLTLR